MPLYGIKAPKNGYCYVYLSNESDEPVYFDNFRVIHNRGRIVEENHYYAYGLKIAALSSRKLGDAAEGKLDNQHLYNGKELIEEADLGWYDYGFRSYDPQIGRFPQLDPLTFAYPYYTPYQYAGCDPITFVDLDGLEPDLPNVTVYAKALPANVRASMSRPLLTSVFRYATQYIYRNNSNKTTQLYEAPMFGNGQSAATNFTDSYGDWELTETRNISFESSQPYDGPTLGAYKRTFSQNLWHNLQGDYPFLYSLINSPWVGAKTLFSGVLGYNKRGIVNLNGDLTTSDERIMGGANALSIPITAVVGAEMRAAEEATTLFRAVDPVEAASIQREGRFLLEGGGGIKTKYFAQSLEDAHWYGQKLYPNGYTFFKGTVKPTLNASEYWFPHIDIGAYAFPEETLPHIIPH